MIERAGVIVHDEVPTIQLEVPLSAADIERARRIRWQWVLLYNRLRSSPGNGAANVEHICKCEEVIQFIDALLAAQPVIH